MPLEPPTKNNNPFFGNQDLLVKVLIADCGGHGRALGVVVRKNPVQFDREKRVLCSEHGFC